MGRVTSYVKKGDPRMTRVTTVPLTLLSRVSKGKITDNRSTYSILYRIPSKHTITIREKSLRVDIRT